MNLRKEHYEVYIEQAAEKDLKALPVEYFRNVIRRIQALSNNPHPSGCRKIKGSDNYWRIRIGNYRVLYEIDSTAKAVRVFRVKHRREIYR